MERTGVHWLKELSGQQTELSKQRNNSNVEFTKHGNPYKAADAHACLMHSLPMHTRSARQVFKQGM